MTVLNRTGSSDVSWTNLNLATQTGSLATAVLLSLWIRDSAATAGVRISVRKSGAGNATDVQFVCPNAANFYSAAPTVAVPCDANQNIQYQISASGSGTADARIWLLGYMEDF